MKPWMYLAAFAAMMVSTERLAAFDASLWPVTAQSLCAGKPPMDLMFIKPRERGDPSRLESPEERRERERYERCCMFKSGAKAEGLPTVRSPSDGELPPRRDCDAGLRTKW